MNNIPGPTFAEETADAASSALRLLSNLQRRRPIVIDDVVIGMSCKSVGNVITNRFCSMKCCNQQKAPELENIHNAHSFGRFCENCDGTCEMGIMHLLLYPINSHCM